ncbi:MAG: PAS domain S-box protein [Ignavibacteriales bacterium]|nr:PAS domain S-box protein [Ignavibacteriales bacterium]
MHETGNQSPIANYENSSALQYNQVTPDSLSGYTLSEIADLINILKKKNLELSRENQRFATELTSTELPDGKERSEREAAIIYQIIQGVSTTANLNELLILIHSSLSNLLYAENCFVALYAEETGLFSFPYYIDKYDSPPDPSQMCKSCTAFVYKTGKPLLLSLERFQALVDAGEVELVGENSPSWLGVPLVTPSKTIGVLVLQHYEESDVYSKRDVHFLDSVASQIAIAIERKSAEEELRESEEMFRALFNESTDPILLLNESGFVNCNASTVSILGYKCKEEFLNKNPWELSPERQSDGTRSSEKAESMINKTLTEGYNKFEWTHLRSDGTELPVEVMLTPVMIKGKQFIYTIWRDITNRKMAEEEINRKTSYSQVCLWKRINSSQL